MLPLLSFKRKELLLGKHKLQQHSLYHDQVRQPIIICAPVSSQYEFERSTKLDEEWSGDRLLVDFKCICIGNSTKHFGLYCTMGVGFVLSSVLPS